MRILTVGTLALVVLSACAPGPERAEVCALVQSAQSYDLSFKQVRLPVNARNGVEEKYASLLSEMEGKLPAQLAMGQQFALELQGLREPATVEVSSGRLNQPGGTTICTFVLTIHLNYGQYPHRTRLWIREDGVLVRIHAYDSYHLRDVLNSE